MTHTVTLGAPSLTGEDANLLVSALFADATYPLTVVIQNHMPRDVVFPEVGGLFLRHVANTADSQATVIIADHDQFQRLASSVAQIAELNGYAQALTISDVSQATSTGASTGSSGGQIQPSDGLTAEQIKEALRAKGIEFAPNAKKADLAALLDTAPNGTDTSTETGSGANGADATNT